MGRGLSRPAWKDRMIYSIKNTKAAASALIFILSSQNLLAQNSNRADAGQPDFKDIYRIELIIFANNNELKNDGYNGSNNYAHTENWQSENKLAYPKKLIFFKSPEKYPQVAPNTDQDNADAIDGTITAESKTIENIIPPLMTYLPADAYQLNDIANPINRRSAHRVLFHKAWDQALESKKAAPSIPISGGKRYDQHHELEGSISFSKGRFLHITTNLWLSQYQSGSSAYNQYESYSTGDADSANRWSSSSNYIPPFPQNKKITLDNIESSSYESDRRLFEDQNSGAFQKYQAAQTYVLKEYRKMKRNEVHYLDHPMFGVIVQISKYEVAENNSE